MKILMPVVITKDNYDLWLDRNIQDPESLKHLLEPIPGEWLQFYKVGLEVNNPANDSEEIIKPV